MAAWDDFSDVTIDDMEDVLDGRSLSEKTAAAEVKTEAATKPAKPVVKKQSPTVAKKTSTLPAKEEPRNCKVIVYITESQKQKLSLRLTEGRKESAILYPAVGGFIDAMD